MSNNIQLNDNIQISFKNEKDYRKYLIKEVFHETRIPKSVLKRLSLKELLRIYNLDEHDLNNEEDLVEIRRDITNLKYNFKVLVVRTVLYTLLGLACSFEASLIPHFISNFIMWVGLAGTLGIIAAGTNRVIRCKKDLNLAIDDYIDELREIVNKKEQLKIKEAESEYSDNLESELTCEKKVEASKEKKKTGSSNKKKLKEVEDIEEMSKINDYNV